MDIKNIIREEINKLDWIKDVDIDLGGKSQEYFKTGDKYIINNRGEEKVYTFVDISCMSEEYKRKLLRQLHPSKHEWVENRDCDYYFIEGEYSYKDLLRVYHQYPKNKPSLDKPGTLSFVLLLSKWGPISIREAQLERMMISGDIKPLEKEKKGGDWYGKLADKLFGRK
jgi:hypothetical protein